MRRSTALLRRLALALPVSLLFFNTLSANGRPSKELTPPARLTANDIATPVDLDSPPRFGWHLESAAQTAYEIRVSSTRAKAEAYQGDVWASGKIASARQNDIRYEGPALSLSGRYFWTVRTWNEHDRVSGWSQVASFGTGPGASWAHSTPVWAPPLVDNWSDYKLTTHLTVTQVALGIRFRSPDTNNGYMWQFRGGDNRLVPHRLVNGTYTVIETVNLPAGTLATGKEVEVTIEAVGSTIKTSVDGVLVHTIVDATFPRGGVGVRTGNSEAGTLADLSLSTPDGQVLLQTDFASGDHSFGCGSVANGTLQVGKATNCLNAGVSVDWAFLRKEFVLANKPVAWATAYAVGSSYGASKQYVYKLYLNGRFVGLGPTQSLAGEARYDGFDVTALLEPGRPSTLGVLAYTTKGQAFQAELMVTYADGSQEVIGTDGTWKARTGDWALPWSGSLGTSYYAAPKENLDARQFPFGFDAPGFDDSSWQSARTKSALGTLAAAPIDKVQEQLRAPVSIVEKEPGHYFVDFGRTSVGGVRYQVQKGAVGSTVDLRFGEVTSDSNTVRYQLNTGNTYEDIYTLREGAQTIETWGMRVFRYLEILGAPEPVTADNLKALALVYPFSATGAKFTASDANLESVWQLSKNTIESVNVNFYTDSWTRERTDYEADAYLQLLSTLYLSDDLSLGRYSIDYFRNNRTWPTEWPLYVIAAVHDAWRQTGEIQQLYDAYASLKAKLPEAWFESTTQLVRKVNGSNGCNSTTDCDIVDWPQSERDGYVFQQYNTVINALSYRAYRDMAEMAEAIGQAEDATTFSARAQALRTAINTRLYSQESGSYDDGMDASGNLTGHHSLHASAFALAFGLPEEAEVSRVADYVASRGMACSVYGAAFLIDGLFRANRAQAALGLLTSTGVASWMNMIHLGAGATAEAWDPSLKSNLTYSHPWAASPAFLVPSGVFGIRPIEPGYATFQVEPRPGTLTHASLTVPTVRGTVGTAFDYSAQGAFQLAVQIPGNTKATVKVPVPEETTVLYVNLVAHDVVPQNGYATLSGLEAGCKIISPEPTGEPLRDEQLLGICSSPPVEDGGQTPPWQLGCNGMHVVQ